MVGDFVSTATILVGGVASLAVYSFLIRENPFYRFFEHLFIGIATSISVMLTFRGFLWSKCLKSMLGYDRIPFPDGTYPTEYNPMLLLYLIPIGIGMFYYALLFKRFAWMAEPVIGLTLGASGGLAFKGIVNELSPQIQDSFRPLYIPGDLYGSISNIVFVAVLFCVLTYFFFTFRRSPRGAAEKASFFGRWMMMGCFGAFFGATIMARMALLVERIEFFVNSWIPAIVGLGG